MEKIALSKTAYPKAYVLLTKPGIILGNAITTSAGFALASFGHFNLFLFLSAVAGLSLIIGSACIFNNFIDRCADQKMERTKGRIKAIEMIGARRALFFAIFLLMGGALFLIFFVNFLSLALALFGFFAYVVLYSYSKYRTIHGTLIGSIAGAVPPVIGYTAASGKIDLTAITFFLLLIAWQMPHFFAIAIYRLREYQAASIPVFPILKGIYATKVRMLCYVIAFLGVSILLALVANLPSAYLVATVLLGLGWLWFSMLGFQSANNKLWARKMFSVSLAVIMGNSIAIFLCLIYTALRQVL